MREKFFFRVRIFPMIFTLQVHFPSKSVCHTPSPPNNNNNNYNYNNNNNNNNNQIFGPLKSPLPFKVSPEDFNQTLHWPKAFMR